MDLTPDLNSAAGTASRAPLFLADLAATFGPDRLQAWLSEPHTQADYGFVVDRARPGPWHGHDALVVCRTAAQSPWWARVEHLRGRALVTYARTNF
jgi:hypothetical protein